MKIRRNSVESLHEPPAVLMVDIAFNLLIFFVVCASSEPQDGRRQEIPGSESQASQKAQQTENIEVKLTRSTVAINGSPVRREEFSPKLKGLLQGRARPEERVVLVKSDSDTPYEHWIDATGLIEAAGGIITLQIEESREVQVK